MKRSVTGLLIIASALATWGFWLEPASLKLTTNRLAVPGWPSACDHLRVVVLADLHTGSPFNDLEKLERIVRVTNEADPDLILLAGDYVIHGVVGGQFEAPENSAKVLGQLSAPIGVYGVLGNHDWWFDAPRVQAALESASVMVLEDRSIKINRGECEFWLTGISDFWEGPHDVATALEAVPKSDPVLLFTHNPDLFTQLPSGITLTVAGHTHGGQVRLPFIGRPVVPSDYGERFAEGHVVENGRHLFVSPGLGTSILPLRFRVPPEITLLILDSGPDSTDTRGEPRRSS